MLVAAFAIVTSIVVTAAAICLLKGRRLWFVLGLLVSAVMIFFTIEAGRVGKGLSELGLLAGFTVIGLPATVVLLIGAGQPAVATSWWAQRALRRIPPPQ